MRHSLSLITLVAACLAAQPARAEGPWPAEKARAWAEKTPWLVGCNYTPAYAINQLEMWQADTFDLAAIDRELGWAEHLGFTSIRVFLHDLLWQQDPEGFLERMDAFLATAAKHRIGVMFVLFDSVWDPSPALGPQRPPKPHVHNSGWVQSPGAAVLKDPAKVDALEGYVKAVVTRFKDDPRVQVWDIINEPDNNNRNSYGHVELPDKADRALALMEKAFAWARACNPAQPLTAGVWVGDWGDPAKLAPWEKFQLEQSDVISFHAYGASEETGRRITNLERYGRPILCTEYMARPQGSTFDPILGLMKDRKVGAYCWGFVAGKSQTIYPWETWQKTYTAEPKVWFHDIFRTDGTPFDPAEVDYIRRITGAAQR
jgi:hypothetical protein